MVSVLVAPLRVSLAGTSTYLHGSRANVVIDNINGCAHLADFSLITLVPDHSTILSTWVEADTVPWMSLELLGPQSFGLTKIFSIRESGRYALWMGILVKSSVGEHVFPRL